MPVRYSLNETLQPTVQLGGVRGAGVVVIGAGVAGLAAAGHLRAQGVSTTLIEAGPRIGGRAHTVLVGSDPFDLGATWLHDADRNPLVRLATPEDRLVDTDRDRRERLSRAGRHASPAELADYDAAWDRLDAVIAPALAGPDVTLGTAMSPMMDDPWARLVALWEGAIIAAADADRLGLRDWHRNRLGGRNLVPRAGVGAFLVRHLATEAVLATPALRIAWGGSGVSVETARGVIKAAAAIITVSTGVLAAGSIRFDPTLPPEVQASIEALPMGLLTKVAIPAPDAHRFGLEPGTVLADRDGCMTFNAWPLGRSYLTGFVGGDRAWSLARDAAAVDALARAELGRMLGSELVRQLPPAAIVTNWGCDPAFAGAYAYAGPGDADARGALGTAFPAERLLFAGEATRTDGLAGTVAGAYLSGVEAARRLLG